MIQVRIFFAWLMFTVIVVAGAQSDQTPATVTELGDPVTESSVGDGDAGGASQATMLARPYLQDELQLLVGNVQRPNAIAWLDEQLYTVCNGDWTIYQIDDRTGDTITFVFGIRNGNSMLAESSEDGLEIWVPDPDSQTLWMVDQGRQAPVRISDDLGTPWGITRINDDDFLITNTQDNAIVQVSESGETSTILSELRSPTGITTHANRVYFANGGSARRGIEWIEDLDDGSYSEPKSLVSGLQNTTNILMGSDSRLYFAYALGTRGVIGRINPIACLDDGCDNADVEMVVFSDIPAPIAMALSPDMRLFLHSRFRPEIYWLQLPA